MSSFPLAAISRLRMATDGCGVTTLVAAAGCPIRCRLCINPETWNGKAKVRNITPDELLDAVRIDSLYFITTGGGITFGGGEPLLHTGFISEFAKIKPDDWKLNAETSLQIPEENVEEAAKAIDHFFIDIKDTNSEIYRAYTGGDNTRVLKNLERLLSLTGSERITVRLPLIPGFNTTMDVDKSETVLSDMGITLFDRFEYTDKRKDNAV